LTGTKRKGRPAMYHPYLITALAEDRRRLCPCGAIADRPWVLCRKCSARIAWQRKATRKNRRAARRPARPRRFGTTVDLLQSFTKGVEN
jgi:hypothetical protein